MHRIIYEDVIGADTPSTGGQIMSCSSMPAHLRSALLCILGAEARLTAIQRKVVEAGVFGARSPDMVVCAPTNSGKSLAGWFRVLATVLPRASQRSVFVAPLKAIAEEKRSELERLCSAIESAGGPHINHVISTGDYVTTGEFMDSPPPKCGEIVICTPERLDVALRQEAGRDWVRAVGSYVFDEFQLLGDRKRGPVMDRLLTHLLMNCPWSRIMTLSATIGNPEAIRSWLAHLGREVVAIEDKARYPCLERRVVSADNKDAWIAEFAKTLRNERERTALVFVSTRARTRAVARRIAEVMGGNIVIEFHAGLTGKERTQRVAAVVAGSSRVVVTTTSLKMGINLPVTDVVILDGDFADTTGARRLSTSDLLQMMGRAGRGDASGRGWLIGSEADAEIFADLLQVAKADDLKPSWIDCKSTARQGLARYDRGTSPLRQAVLSALALRVSMKPVELSDYLSHGFASLSDSLSASDIQREFSWMIENKLCFLEEGSADSYKVTKIGQVIAAMGISPETGALFAAFLRAMLKLGESAPRADGRRRDYVSSLTDLDLLILTCASYELRHEPVKLGHGKQLVEKTAGYLEEMRPDSKPFLSRWRNANDRNYPTRRLLATLRIPHDPEKTEECERIFWQLVAGAVLLHRHSTGVVTQSLEREGAVEGGDFESSWRPLAIWLLRSLAALCDPARAYRMRSIRLKALSLSNNIAVGCELGRLLRIDGIGLQTVLHLKQAGFTKLQSLGTSGYEEFTKAGVHTRQITLLKRWLERRRQ